MTGESVVANMFGAEESVADLLDKVAAVPVWFWPIFVTVVAGLLVNLLLRWRQRQVNRKGLAEALATEVKSSCDLSRIWLSALERHPPERELQGVDYLLHPATRVYESRVGDIGLLHLRGERMLDKIAHFYFAQERLGIHIAAIRAAHDPTIIEGEKVGPLAKHYEGHLAVGRELYPLLKSIADGRHWLTLWRRGRPREEYEAEFDIPRQTQTQQSSGTEPNK